MNLIFRRRRCNTETIRSAVESLNSQGESLSQVTDGSMGIHAEIDETGVTPTYRGASYIGRR
jgi:hypothetical protein